MVNYTEWFTERTNGKIQINSTAIYRYLSLEVVERLDSNLSVNEIIDWLEIRHEKPLAVSMEKILKGVLLTTLREDGMNL